MNGLLLKRPESWAVGTDVELMEAFRQVLEASHLGGVKEIIHFRPALREGCPLVSANGGAGCSPAGAEQLSGRPHRVRAGPRRYRRMG